MLGNARVSFREAVIGAVALAAAACWTGGAAAQDQQSGQQQQQQQQQPPQEGPVLITGTIDCRYALRPAETTICSTPVLAAMDLQMSTLFQVLGSLVTPEVGAQMGADQESYLKEREACASDVECIGTVTAGRIGELDSILKEIAKGGPY